MSVRSSRPRLLVIALDAADPGLLRRWMGEGLLPELAALASGGADLDLDTGAEVLHESTWPTLHTGCQPGSHGTYNWRCLRPGTYSLLRSPERSYRLPWWVASRGGAGTLLVDVPWAAEFPSDGLTALQGWGERGAWSTSSWPPRLLDEVESRYGRYPRWVDLRHRGSLRSQRRLLETLERAVEVRTELTSWLMRTREWEACMVCYWEPHNAGHAFHRLVNPDSWAYDPSLADRLEDALLRVYRAADRGLGRLLAEAGPDPNVLVVSRMGMERNGSGGEIPAKLLTALGHQVPASRPGLPRPQAVVRSLIPAGIRRRIETRLGGERRESLMEAGFRDSIDWERTRAFAESEPGLTAIRVNLAGREPAGTVAPGPEYDGLCDELTSELAQLRVERSGEPAVLEVLRRDRWLEGPHAEHLPDLVIRWDDRQLLDAVRHPRVGLISNPVAGIPASEHTGSGILVASGPSVRNGGSLGRAQLADVAPTMLALLGAGIPEGMDGRPLTELLAGGTVPERVELDWHDDPWAPSPATPPVLAAREAA